VLAQPIPPTLLVEGIGQEPHDYWGQHDILKAVARFAHLKDAFELAARLGEGDRNRLSAPPCRACAIDFGPHLLSDLPVSLPSLRRSNLKSNRVKGIVITFRSAL
jgi:hypothetical protein